MKKISLIFSPFFAISAFGASQITADQINQNAAWNTAVNTAVTALTVTYVSGLSTSTSVDNQPTFQAAVTATVGAGGGRCNVPTGTYRVDSAIAGDLNVSLWGQGMEATILKCHGATDIFTLLSPAGVNGFNTGCNYMTLDGNNVGLSGIHYRETGLENFTALRVRRFTTAGVYFEGVPIVSFNHCEFTENVIGIKGYKEVGGGAFQTNHIIFYACRFDSNTAWAADIQGSANWVFYGTDFEVNGTAANDNTGIIRATGMCPNGEGRAVTLDGCWAERNSGFAALHIKSPAQSNTQYTWTNSLERYGTALKYGIYVDTSASTTSQVLTQGLTLGDHSINDVKLVDARGTWNQGPSSVTLGSNDTSSGTVHSW